MKSLNQELEVIEEFRKLPKTEDGWVVKKELIKALAKKWDIADTSVYFHLQKCLEKMKIEEITVDRVKYIKILEGENNE